MKRSVLSLILAFSLVLSVFSIPTAGYAQETGAVSLITNDTAAKEFYANGNYIEIWSAPDEMKAQGYDLEINVLGPDGYRSLETHYITSDYTVYGGGKTGAYEITSVQMYGGHVATIVAGGKAGSVGDNEIYEDGGQANVFVYGGQVDTIKFFEDGYVDYANIFINDSGDSNDWGAPTSKLSIANIIVGAEAGEKGKFTGGNITAVTHSSLIKLTPGYCGGMPLKEAMADLDDWKHITIEGEKFTGLDSFESITNCRITGEDNPPADIALCDVRAISNQKYTGKALTPAITITDGEIPLVKDVNYTVTYSNNIDPGTATVTVKGIVNYQGSVTRTFEIIEPLTEGTVVKDADNTAKYEVTESEQGGVEVAYTAPVNKEKTTVTIPATVKLADGTVAEVTSIDAKAFNNNKNLTKVIIGKNVETIGNSAFAKCTSLESVTLPADVEKIGSRAFYGDKKLKIITIKSKKLKASKVGKQAFKGVYSKAKVNVPNSKVKAYKGFFYKKGLSKKAKIS